MSEQITRLPNEDVVTEIQASPYIGAPGYPNNFYSRVNQEPHDNDETTIFTYETTFLNALFRFENLPAEATINSLVVGCWMKWWGRMKFVIDIDGVIYESPELVAPGDVPYEKFEHELTVNPATGQPWTVADVNNLIAGVALLSGARITEVYLLANIETPPPDEFTLFHSCDEVTEPKGTWFQFDTESNPGQQTYYDVTINRTEQSEGTGCVEVVVPAGPLYHMWLFLSSNIGSPIAWDFNAEPILRFRIKQKGRIVPIQLRLVTREPEWEWFIHDYGDIGSELILDQWVEYSIDLRQEIDGTVLTPEALAATARLSFQIDNNKGDAHVLIDFLRTSPATTPPPLGVSVTPKAINIDIGETVTLTAKAYGGSAPYLIEWFLGGQLKQSRITDGLDTYTFIGEQTGGYNFTVKVTDDANNTYEDSASIYVKPPLPPIIPCRPLHITGNKIYNDLNQLVNLYGANLHGFADTPNSHWITQDGSILWGQNTLWDTQLVYDQLLAMKSWGMTCIRTIISIELFLNDIDSQRAKYKEFLSIASELGLYVIFVPYRIRYYGQPGVVHTKIPYPPYLNADELAATGWTSSQDFVDFWTMLASEFINYNNVIFELFNEPNGTPEQETEWFDVVQRCINAIRTVGSNHIIIPTWDYNASAYYGPTYPGEIQPGGITLDWVFNYPLTDPVGNLAYETHIYRVYGGPGWIDAEGQWSNRKVFYKKEDLRRGFNDLLLNATAQKHPLIIGEFGAWLDGPPPPAPADTSNLNAELNAFWNLTQTCKENGWHFIAWWWWPSGPLRLLEAGVSDWSPNEVGQILIDAMVIPPPPKPSIPLGLFAFTVALILINWGMSKKG